MFRFSIRELVLVTLVVAIGVGWWLDHQRLKWRADEAQAQWLEVHTGISRFGR